LIDDEIVLARAAADGDTGEVGRLLESGIQHSLRRLFDPEERRGIPKRYGRGLYSTRRTKTRQVPGFEFDKFVPGRGRGLLLTFSPVVDRMPSHAISVS
jgi:hypothetical protein